MKRSEINTIIENSLEFIKSLNFLVPEFAYWTPDQWNENKERCQEIKDNMLGWDITDFGGNNFSRKGLVMLTLRNGNLKLNEKYKKPYAEKILITEENQETPCHFHWSKMEDIINRGGGDLAVELWNSGANEERLDTEVAYRSDGALLTAKAGEPVIIKPGQSISLEQGVYHRFYGVKGTGRVLLGEVSSVNDDTVDNRFYESIPRFPDIEEDEPARFLLITEY